MSPPSAEISAGLQALLAVRLLLSSSHRGRYRDLRTQDDGATPRRDLLLYEASQPDTLGGTLTPYSDCNGRARCGVSGHPRVSGRL